MRHYFSKEPWTKATQILCWSGAKPYLNFFTGVFLSYTSLLISEMVKFKIQHFKNMSFHVKMSIWIMLHFIRVSITAVLSMIIKTWQSVNVSVFVRRHEVLGQTTGNSQTKKSAHTPKGHEPPQVKIQICTRTCGYTRTCDMLNICAILRHYVFACMCLCKAVLKDILALLKLFHTDTQ